MRITSIAAGVLVTATTAVLCFVIPSNHVISVGDDGSRRFAKGRVTLMIGVVLEDENGKRLSEEVCAATSLVSQPNDARFICLRFIDPYGGHSFQPNSNVGAVGRPTCSQTGYW